MIWDSFQRNKRKIHIGRSHRDDDEEARIVQDGPFEFRVCVFGRSGGYIGACESLAQAKSLAERAADAVSAEYERACALMETP